MKEIVNTYNKGISFEAYTKRFLEISLEGCRVFMNTRMYCPRIDKNTEVDCIVFYRDTMFILELKSPRNMLAGYSYNINWQCVSGKRWTPIYSPVLQNNLHIRTIRNILGPKLINTVPMVCVPNECIIKTDYIDTVFTLESAVKHILNKTKSSDRCINKLGIEYIMNKLRRTIR